VGARTSLQPQPQVRVVAAVSVTCVLTVAWSDPIRVSTLNLVDLAGSENAKMTNSKGERAREAKHINQSLLTLSTIIHRLCDESLAAAKSAAGAGGAADASTYRNKSQQHFPYRDSKLTR
jgi:centromeric protein E